MKKKKILKNQNILFGVNSEEDNKETINYTRIGNMAYSNNNTNNLLYVMGNNYVNMPYYYMMSNNIGNNNTSSQSNNSPTQIPSYNNF